MRILFIGDIFGESAIEYLKNNLNNIKKEHKINLVLANGENASNGRGLKLKHYQELMKLGITSISMGNHTFSVNEIYNYIDDSNIIRPANFNTNIGKGYKTFKYNDVSITFINLLGRVNMNNLCLDCPFKTLDEILSTVQSDYYIVDIHAETTSEKIALGLDFDGKVTAVLGTHTHIPTADEQILPKGTLYITDVGMTGPKYGVIGNEADAIISRFRTGIYSPAKVQSGDIVFNAVILDINKNGVNSIKRLNIK